MTPTAKLANILTIFKDTYNYDTIANPITTSCPKTFTTRGNTLSSTRVFINE